MCMLPLTQYVSYKPNSSIEISKLSAAQSNKLNHSTTTGAQWPDPGSGNETAWLEIQSTVWRKKVSVHNAYSDDTIEQSDRSHDRHQSDSICHTQVLWSSKEKNKKNTLISIDNKHTICEHNYLTRKKSQMHKAYKHFWTLYAILQTTAKNNTIDACKAGY